MSKEKPNNKAKLIHGAVGPLLVKLTIPMIWGLLAIMAFNLVDTIYIGHLGTKPLAAIGFTFPVVMVVTNLSIGLGIGTSSAVARAIGSEGHEKIRTLASSSLILSVCLVAMVVIVGLLTIEPLFRALGAQEDTILLIKDYMQIWYVGVIFLVVPMVGNYIIRATGDMLWPGIIMVISAVINLILDPFLIFGWWIFPRLEMKGAAIATLVSWVLSMFASLSILYFREKLLCFRCPKPAEIYKAWKSILHVAIPAAGTHMIIPFGGAIIMMMVASFGEEAVAAFGAASRIEMFAFIIVLALSAIIGPFVGQNMGVKRYDRIKEALKLCYLFCLYFGLGIALLLATFATPLIRMFSHDPLVMHYGRMYLYIIPIGYFAHGVIYIASGVFNGSGHPMPAAIISIIRMFVLYIPLAYIMKSILGVYGIFGSYSLTTIIMGVVACVWSYGLVKGYHKTTLTSK